MISPHLYNVIISSFGRDKRETIKFKDLLNNRIGLKAEEIYILMGIGVSIPLIRVVELSP